MSVSRSSRGVTSMENHGIEILARSVKPSADPGFLQGADDALNDEEHEEDDHEGEVEHPHRRDDAPERSQHRLGGSRGQRPGPPHRAAGAPPGPRPGGAGGEAEPRDGPDPTDPVASGG